MAVLTADFETGVNGVRVYSTDPGSASAFDFANTNGNGAQPPYYTNVHAHGSLGCYVSGAGDSAGGNAGWSTSLGGAISTEFYGRTYLNVPFGSLPSGYSHFLYTSGTGTFGSDSIAVRSDSHIGIDRGGVGWEAVSSNTIPLNQWIRIEYHYNLTVGQITCRMYLSADSATYTEEFATGTSSIGEVTTTSIIPVCQDSDTMSVFYFDQIVTNASTWPGAFPVNSTPCTVSGGTSVGSLLTAAAGSWNGTFTLGYQWRRNGVNIGGATSSTYTTVSADAGTTVDVVETATGQVATNENASQASSNAISVAPAGAVARGGMMLIF